jgi:two-component system NtrC family sensor kinase
MKVSLRTKLIISFLAVIIICGLIATVVAVRLIGTGIISQAEDNVKIDLNIAKHIYQDELQEIKALVHLSAQRFFIKNALSKKDLKTLRGELEEIRKRGSLDILTLTDKKGRVIVRSQNPSIYGDDQANDQFVRQVLVGEEMIAGTAIIPRYELIKEGANLVEQAYMKVIATAKAKPMLETEETSAMIIKAASPVLGSDGTLLGILYGGSLLNRNCKIVDKVKHTIYQGVKYKGKDIGIATIFQADLRISTNVKQADGSRAIGTRVSQEVYEQVLEKGLPWIDRAFVVSNWYIAAYEPIRGINGEIVGVLSTGILEEKFADMRRSAVLDFLGLTIGGMIIALVVSSFLARGVLKPIKHLVFASRQLAEGDLEHQVKLKSKDEIGELGETFNLMASSLKERDDKLKEHTSQQIMKSERLATLGQLAAGVAHEINNPLGTISIYAQMILDELGKDNDSCRESLEVVMKQTNRAGRIVKDLLEFARQSEPEMRILNINDVLRKAIEITTHSAELQNISLAKYLVGELPDVQGDTDKLQQVFVNIIINAIQAMPEGGELTVGTRLTEDGEFVEVEISDTGCGIPQEHLSKLFDPFFSTKGTGEGTGLGLSVSLGIIQKHKGTIDVKSKVGVGSTFTIRLPVEEN